MNEETNFLAVEDRLQTEAKRLLTDRQVSAAQLAGLYRRRQRLRRAAQLAGVTTVVLLAGLALRFGGRTEIAPRPSSPQRSTVAQIGRRPQAPQASFPPKATQVTQPDQAVFGIPFVIGDPAAGGEEVITGIYIPEQVEPIDLRDLSPAERDAVRAVLGIEGENTELIRPI